MAHQTTPIKVDGRVRAFLRDAGLNEEEPVHLPFTCIDKRYRPAYCLDNCAHAANAGLGTVVYGWMIWELRRLRFIEAEFHSVISQGGQLLDITPRTDGEELILFVPDPGRAAVFTGHGWQTFTNINSMNGIVRSSTLSTRPCDLGLH